MAGVRAEFESLVAAWGGVPPAKPVGESRPARLTVGIATYDDFDGAYFTVHSLLMYHSAVMREAEIIILDNHPTGPAASALAGLATENPQSTSIRYIPYDEVQSTAFRDVLFREASGEVVLVLDSHVLIAAGGLEALLDYYVDPANQQDMVQGPLVRGDGSVAATHMVPEFKSGMYGYWGTDERGIDPSASAFEIGLHGLGLFAMRRQAWPGLNPRFRGFGGEEGYVQEKVRRGGGKVVCLPALRWHHRFARPAGAPYSNRWDDRINNYLVGWEEIGYDTTPVLEHFAELLGPAAGDLVARASSTISHPLHMVDGLIVLSDDTRFAPWAQARTWLGELGVSALRASVAAASAGGPDPVAAAIADALHRGRRRGWRTAMLLDESWRVDLGGAHALERVTRSTGPDATVVVSMPATAAGFLPGAILTPTATDGLESSLESWLTSREASRIDLAVPPSSPEHPVDLRGHVGAVCIWSDHEIRELWKPWKSWFARWELAQPAQ